MKRVKVLPGTISQLESLKDNAQSFMHPDGSHDQVWDDDMTALDNAIEIIGAYQKEPNPVRPKMCEEAKMLIFMGALIILALIAIPLTIILL
jgi:hypothetical protein